MTHHEIGDFIQPETATTRPAMPGPTRVFSELKCETVVVQHDVIDDILIPNERLERIIEDRRAALDRKIERAILGEI